MIITILFITVLSSSGSKSGQNGSLTLYDVEVWGNRRRVMKNKPTENNSVGRDEGGEWMAAK